MLSSSWQWAIFAHPISSEGREGGAALCLSVIKLFTLQHTQTVFACTLAQLELP